MSWTSNRKEHESTRPKQHPLWDFPYNKPRYCEAMRLWDCRCISLSQISLGQRVNCTLGKQPGSPPLRGIFFPEITVSDRRWSDFSMQFPLWMVREVSLDLKVPLTLRACSSDVCLKVSLVSRQVKILFVLYFKALL